MKRARHAAALVGRILLLTSLLAVVLVLALWTGGPALVVAVFTAVVLLAPLAAAPVRIVPAFAGARRRRRASRAPPRA